MSRAILCLFAQLAFSGSVFSQYINYCTPNTLSIPFDNEFEAVKKSSNTPHRKVRYDPEAIYSKNFNEDGVKLISAVISEHDELQANPIAYNFAENYFVQSIKEASPLFNKGTQYPILERNATKSYQYSFFSKSSGCNFTKSLFYISPNYETEADHALMLEDQYRRNSSIDPINLEYFSWVLGISNQNQSSLHKSNVSIAAATESASRLDMLIKNQLAFKNNNSGITEFSQQVIDRDPFDKENLLKADSESLVQTSDLASNYSITRNRRAQTMVDGSTYYWEMTDFDDTSTSNDLFTFDGTNTSSYNITVEIAPLSSGSKGTANDDTAQGSGVVWGKPMNSSNAWQNGNPSQSFNFMTIMTNSNVIPVSNISVNSDAISYYLGNWWGHWDVTSSQNGFQTDYQLNYHFEFTGAPEPSTYLMTSALFGLIGMNRTSRKSIIKLALRSKQFLLSCAHREYPKT